MVAKKLERSLLLIFVFCLIFNFNHSIYAQKEDIVTPSGLSKSALHNTIESYVKKHKDTTAGLAITVFNDKEELYLGNHGYADLENQVTISEDTVFEWGSVSKLLVWVSVFQLWEQDRIDLNEDIRTYLPEGFLKKINENEKITMINLMHHDAGWQEAVVDLFVKDIRDVQNLKETLQNTEPEQIYPVGKYKAYSNWGTALAAYIVQEITGQKYYDYVHENVFRPLNMEDTALLPDLRDNQWVQERRRQIKGYTPQNKIIKNDFDHIVLYPSGMATGTLKDLEKFGKGLISYKGQQNLFQKEETVNRLLNPTLYYEGTDYPRNSNGFWFAEFAVSVLGHTGTTRAFSTNLLIDPISKTCAIVMTNQSYESIYNFEMMPLIFGDFNPKQSPISLGEKKNIDGIYGSSRTFLKGYGKLHSIITRVKVKEIDDNQLRLTALGTSLHGYEFKDSFYNIEDSLWHIYKDKDESIIMSTGDQDFVKLSTFQVIIEYSLVFLAILVLLYSIIMLAIELVAFIRSKIKNKSSPNRLITKLHLFTLFVILFVFINVLIMAYKMISYDVFRNIRPHVYLSFFFMITLLGCFVYSIVILKKSNIKRRIKIKYILTSIASLVISLNIYYWQLYLIR